MRIFYKEEYLKEVETIEEVNNFIKEHGCENEPVRVYFRTNQIGIVNSIEEAEALREKHREANLAFYQPMIEESKTIIEEIEKARHIHNSTDDIIADNFESNEQYDEFFKENYPDLVSRIENLGRRLYMDKFIEVFAHDASGKRVGCNVKLEPWQIYNDDPKDKTTRYECISGFGLKCVTKFARSWLFEYLIGDVMVQPDKLDNDKEPPTIWGARNIEEYTDMSAVPDEVKKEIYKFMDFDIVSDGRTYVGINRCKDRIVGIVSLSEKDGEYTLMNVTVDEQMQHQGIATCLLAHALDFVGNSHSVDLFVQDYQERAVRLFKRFGFWTKREVDLFGPKLIYMERPAGSWELWRIIHDYN